MPGETPAVFGDALRRLAAAATYLYQDGPRAWYAHPAHGDEAGGRSRGAAQARSGQGRQRAGCNGCAPISGGTAISRASIRCPAQAPTYPTIYDARLVVLPAEHAYSKESGNAAEVAAKAILESRGNTPRLYRNTLVFLAADKVRLQDLDEALRKYLAWSSIVAEKETLNLDPHQARQAETQKQAADGAVTARLPETYQWLLVPEQTDAAGSGRLAGLPAHRQPTRSQCGSARSCAATSC